MDYNKLMLGVVLAASCVGLVCGMRGRTTIGDAFGGAVLGGLCLVIGLALLPKAPTHLGVSVLLHQPPLYQLQLLASVAMLCWSIIGGPYGMGAFAGALGRKTIATLAPPDYYNFKSH